MSPFFGSHANKRFYGLRKAAKRLTESPTSGDRSSKLDRRHDSLHLQDSNLPDELRVELGKLDELFWVSQDRLKAISKHFGEELEEGLREDGGNIPMNLTWVLGFPTGRERGSFLTLDLGGTNLRTCWVELAERKGETKVTQSQFQLPNEIKTGNAEQLLIFIAESLESFIQDHRLAGTLEEPLPLGFTFSYPATQEYIDHGILQTWTKGFDIDGVEGHDVVQQLQEAIAKKDLPIRLIALTNDTTGAMIASAYNDPDTIIGAIFGTGCNAAYMEHCGSIPKLQKHNKAKNLSPDTQMAINCEYGAFDNSHQILPRTKYDETVDKESPKPGEQTFEKMSAGLYLGEIFRLIVLELYHKRLIFKDQTDLSYIEKPYSIDTAILSSIENDESSDLSEAGNLLRKEFNLEASKLDLQILRHLAITVAVRGARLCSCGVAAICQRKGISKGHVAADGSVANKHPKFKKRWAQALGEILDWPEDRAEGEDPIILTSAEDGSGVGAAVVAAMTMERAKSGDMIGMRMGS